MDNKLEKIIKYGIILAFLLPLAFTSRTFFPWHFGKTILFQILAGSLLVLALLDLNINRKKLFKLNWLDKSIMLLSLALIASAIFGVDFNRSFWGDQQRAQGIFTWLHFVIFYFVIRQYYVNIKDWKILSYCVVCIGLISCFFAWFGGYFSSLNSIITYTKQLGGMIGNPIFFGNYLTVPTFLSFVLFFIETGKKRYGFLIAGLLLVLTLIFTKSAGVVLGFIFGLFAVWLLYIFFSDSKKYKKVVVAIGMILLVCVGGLFFLVSTNQKIINFPMVTEIFNLDPNSFTANTRILTWQIALKGFLEKPIFGWGWNNFQNLFDNNYNPEFLKFSFAETIWDKPHNFFLEVLSTAGAVGFFSYIFLLVISFSYLCKMIKNVKDQNMRSVYILIAGCLCAYLVQISFSFETSNSLLNWFFLLALISFLFASLGKEAAVDLYENIKNRYIVIFSTVLIVLSLYSVYTSYSFYKGSVLMGDAGDAVRIQSVFAWEKNAKLAIAYKWPFLWENAMFLTRDLVEMDKANLINKQNLEPISGKLIGVYEAELNKDKTDFFSRYWLGQLYSLMGEKIDNKYYIDSDKYYNEALSISPANQKVIVLLAKNKFNQNQDKEGIVILEELVKKNPDFVQPHWFLGLGYIRQKDFNRGIDELEKGKMYAFESANNILFMVDLYAERKQYNKIVPLYEELIKIQPNKAAGYYANLSAVYLKLDDKEKVIESLNKAVELDPSLSAEAQEFLKKNKIIN